MHRRATCSSLYSTRTLLPSFCRCSSTFEFDKSLHRDESREWPFCRIIPSNSKDKTISLHGRRLSLHGRRHCSGGALGGCGAEPARRPRHAASPRPPGRAGSRSFSARTALTTSYAAVRRAATTCSRAVPMLPGAPRAHLLRTPSSLWRADAA